MSSLFASLGASADALTAFSRSLDVIQNNVTNASTPGYARQRLTLEAAAFDPLGGLSGGVEAGELQSSRNKYADQAVRQQLQDQGRADQKVSSLTALQSNFDISGKTGIPGALSALFQNISSWSVNPNDSSLRTSVVQSARTLAQSFQSAAAQFDQASITTGKQIVDTVNQINALGSQLRQYNLERLGGDQNQPDPGLDAKIHSTLEQLSQLVNFDAVEQSDGTVTVLIGGQTPLVIGDKQYTLQADLKTPPPGSPANSGLAPPARILSSDGRDITAETSGGELAGLLEVRNQVLPQLTGDANNPGDLNRLAKAVADRVNGLLTSGQVSAGPPAVAGSPLFAYDNSNSATTARTLAVAGGFDPANLAAIDPGPPPVSNGIALKLAALASPTDAADEIDGFSYTEFYGNMARKVGSALAAAQDDSDTQAQLVAQAKSLRDQASGVSLDEEAVQLLEFQRAYQATSKMVSVLNELTQTTVDMLT